MGQGLQRWWHKAAQTWLSSERRLWAGFPLPAADVWETCRPRELDSTGGALEQVPCLCSAHRPRQTRPPPLFVPSVSGVRCARPYQMQVGGARTRGFRHVRVSVGSVGPARGRPSLPFMAAWGVAPQRCPFSLNRGRGGPRRSFLLRCPEPAGRDTCVHTRVG